MGIGRFRVAALGGNQEPVLAQQGEQGIAPAGHALHSQQRGDFLAQLARAQPRQPDAHGPHLHQDLLGAPGRARLALAALVEALPAHAVEPAAALHVQAFFGPQAANGRWKDFFGNGMPWSSSTSCSIVRSNKFRSAPSFSCFSHKRYCSRGCASNCLMRCSGLWSIAGEAMGEAGPLA